MAEPTLVVETGAGLTNANSFASLAEAEVIMAVRPAPFKIPWTESDNYKKEQLLIWATQLLIDWVIWPGVQSTSTQVLPFPRAGMVNPDGYLLPSFTVYPFVKRATVELALALASQNLNAEPSRGLDSLRVGPITLDFNARESEQARVIPRSVMAMLRPYGCKLRSDAGAMIGSLPLERS